MGKKTFSAASMEYFNRLLASSPIVIYSCEPRGDMRISFVSANMTSLLGYDPQEFLKDATLWKTLVYPDDLPLIATGLQGIFEKGHLRVEYRFRHKNGTYRWIFDEMMLIRDGEGEISHLAGYWIDVTERRASEEALRGSEQKYRQLVETIGEGIWVLDKDNRTTFVNQRMAEMMGYSAEEMEGRHLFSFIDEHEITKAKANMERRRQGIREQVDFQFLRKDGALIDLAIETSPVIDEGGAYRGAIAALMDITERKRVEKELEDHRVRLEELVMERTAQLQASEERYRELAESISDIFFARDNDLKITYCNSAYEKLVGVRAEDIIGKSVLDIHPQTEAWLRAERLYREVIDKQEPRVWEDEYQVGDRKSYFEVHAYPSRSGLTVISRDITGRKQIDEALSRLNERFELANEAAGVGIWDWDIAAGHIEWTPHMFRLFGLEPHGAHASFDTWHSAMHPEDRKTAETRVSQALKERATLFNEFRIIKPDGEVRWIYSQGRGMYDDEGRPMSMLGICMDITKRKQAEDALKMSEERHKELAGELMRSNSELELFAYAASHDLREPLRKITTFADRLRFHLGGKLDDKAGDYLERMEGAAKRMKELIEGLLKLSKITTQAEPFKRVELREVLSGILSDMEVAIDRSGAIIEAGDLPAIEADPLQMRQLFSNLLSNALKFSNEPPRVLIGSRQIEGQAFEITVADNGIGFDEKYLDTIFQPFQQLHDRGEYEGVGMGLAICQRIVSRHRGKITARSAKGRGTVFVITLPARQGGPSCRS
jgi:PAS domain S-box-containing protein